MSKSVRIAIFLVIVAVLAVVALIRATAPREQDSGIVELRMTLWAKQKDMDFYAEALEQFHKENPNIRVKIENIPWIRMFDKLLVSTAGGRAPDVSRVSSLWFVPCAAKGLLEPLDEYIANDPDFQIEDFYEPAVRGWGTYKDTIYAIPSDVDIYAMYYNKTMFDKYGVPYPDETWDREKYIEMAKKLTIDKDGDGKLDQWGANPDQFWQAYIWQNGGDILSEDRKTCTLDSPEAIAGIQFLVDMRSKYKVAPSPADSADIGPQKMFTNGQIGMYISGSWAAALVFKDEISTFEWDVAHLPKGEKRATFIGGAAFGVLRGSKHKEEAWKLVKFMTSPWMQAHFASGQHIIPSRQSVAESGAYLYLPGAPKNKKVFIEAIEYGHPMPMVPISREMNDIIAAEITRAILGKKTVEEACQWVTPKCNEMLKYMRE